MCQNVGMSTGIDATGTSEVGLRERKKARTRESLQEAAIEPRSPAR